MVSARMSGPAKMKGRPSAPPMRRSRKRGAYKERAGRGGARSTYLRVQGLCFAYFLSEFRYDREEVADDEEIREVADWDALVLIDCNDRTSRPHSNLVLDRAGDAD